VIAKLGSTHRQRDVQMVIVRIQQQQDGPVTCALWKLERIPTEARRWRHPQLRVEARKGPLQGVAQFTDRLDQAYCCRLMVVPARTGETYPLTMLSWPSALIAETPNTKSSMFRFFSVNWVTLPIVWLCSQSLVHVSRQ